MEEDDEFGDLYTDILIPTQTPASTSPPSSTAPVETLPRPTPNPNPTPAAAAAEDDDDWLLGGSDPIPGVEPTGDWADEDIDGGAPAPVAKREAAAPAKPPPAADDLDPLMGGGVDDSGPAIPGLSSSAAAGAAAGSEDWDSDSDDDIQIVLNETNGRRGLGEDEGDDEDGEDLFIVADGPHNPGMEEQDWGEDPASAGAEGERKDGSEPGKAVAAPGGRIGYSGGGPGFHPQHHSMFKYVRPGAPGASAGGLPGGPGQFRPPGPSGPFSGRGRGDWRPAAGRGMNKSFHSGYGMTPWGGSGRGFGGLDFTLPPHKTIFDIDVDTAFEEKPWKYPGADISDFFNFGLDEEKWKDFCKQLDQLRLESTMQSRIRVYESGRSEQDYDPDLPPELAAATGHPDISVGNRNKTDNGHTDFSAQGRGPTNVRAPVMTGRPIQVETNYTDRYPSSDSRPHRMRESDSVIEIVCHGRDSVNDETVDQTEKDSQGGKKGANDVEENKPYPSDKISNSGHKSNLATKTEHKRQLPASSESDMLSTDVNGHSPSYKTRGSPRGARSLKGSSLGQNSTIRETESTNEVKPQSSSKGRNDSRRENHVEGPETRGDSEGSLAAATVADKMSTEDHFDDDDDDGDDDRLTLAGSVELDGDDATSDPNTPSDANEGDNLVHSGKKQKPIPVLEQPSGHNSSEPDELRISENSKGRSGSSKDQQKRLESGEEVLQDRHPRRVNDVRKNHVEDRNLRRKDEHSRDVKPDLERSHVPSRGREDISQSYANRDRVDIRGRSYDRVRETEIWPRREDSVHSRRGKEEDSRLEHTAEVGARHRNRVRPIDRNDRDDDLHSRKRLDDGDWRGSRQRDRGDMVLNRRENLDDSHIKRNKDDDMRRTKPENDDMVHGYRGRDDNNRRKRERDDGIDQKRRDDSGRMREKVDDRYHAKHKDDNWRQREREDRQRPKHENALTLNREEGRGTGRGSRIMDDKLASGGRKKDEPRSSVLSKDNQERTRQTEPSRRGQGVEENNMQNKARSDVHPRDDNANSERNSRQEKQNNNRSDARHAGRDRHRESTRKGRNSESGEHDLHRSSKRRREDHESHRTGKVDTKEMNEQQNSRDHAALSEKSQNPQPDNTLVNQVEEDAISDDENHEDSRRGRSKLERWTSHKEIEYSNIDDDSTQAFPAIKADNQAPTANDEVGKSEDPAAVSNSDIKSCVDTGQTSDKMTEERDRHLDTVERLKRRSERFKLPMPGEKDALQNKKVDTEVQPPQNESAATDVEVKPERPARKRRWTGS